MGRWPEIVKHREILSTRPFRYDADFRWPNYPRHPFGYDRTEEEQIEFGREVILHSCNWLEMPDPRNLDGYFVPGMRHKCPCEIKAALAFFEYQRSLVSTVGQCEGGCSESKLIPQAQYKDRWRCKYTAQACPFFECADIFKLWSLING